MSSARDTTAPLTVHIRSPTLADSISVETSLDTTVVAFKRSLRDAHPGRPEPAEQRLIFQGKLLADSDVLKEVLKKSDLSTAPIFHLVVKSNFHQPSPAPASSISTNQFRQRHVTMMQYPQQSAAPTVAEPHHAQTFPSWAAMPNVHHGYPMQQQYGVPPGYQYVVINGYPYLAPIPSGYPLLPHYHELMVHYAQQQQLAAVLAHANTNLPAPAVPAVPDNNPVALAERRARRSSAVWLAIKLVFMLFVLGQNASIERIIVLHVVAIVIFLYQTERLRFVVRRIGVVPREEVNAAAAPPAPQPAAAPAPTRTEPAPHNPDAGAPAQEPAATEPTAEQSAAVSTPAPVSRLRQVEHALYTFVASLIPTAPDPVAAAAQQEEMGGGF